MNKLIAALLAVTAIGGAGVTTAIVAAPSASARIVAAPTTVPARWEVPPRHATIVPTTFMRTPSRGEQWTGATVVTVSMGKAPSRIVAGPLYRKCC